MKLRRSLAILALTCALGPVTSFAAPGIAVVEAAKIAHDSLKERGLTDQFHVAALVLEKSDVRGSSHYWSVRWSAAIPLSEEKRELGMQINMDGTVVRVVRGAANKNPETGKFDPNGPTGLQNHRTRSDRPSILDLK
ncbi:MAG TPA: hypothetical protein VF614_09615 [Chthoniobacteraceae bacterium]|jgi:hypothetical protein